MSSVNVRKKIKIRDKNLTTWVDKYRPKKISQIIGHDEVKKVLVKTIKNGNLPHLLFYGPSGTGKTSTVLALVNELYGPEKVKSKVLELNASDENGINVVRDKIIKFATFVVGSSDPKYPSPSFKIIILDEADAMTSEAQTALKKVMESTCDVTRFVFICNYENRIIDPIKSRCASFKFSPIPEKLILNKLKNISKNEKINVKDDVLQIITKICQGDARRSVNTLQNIKYIPKKNITKDDIYNITSYVSEDHFKGVWDKCLKNDIINLSKLATDITNTGYPMNFILNYLSEKTLSSKMNDNSKSKILLMIGKVERMINDGSDNYIQLLTTLSYINSVNRKLDVDNLKIF
jgi:replication factor C subunit 2/4